MAACNLPVNSGFGGNIQILLQDSYGGFDNPYSYSYIPGVADLSVADFNGDGAPDVAFANFGDLNTGLGGNVGIALNLGKPAAGNPLGSVRSFAAGLQPLMLVTGDMSGAGNDDVAVTNYDGVSVLRGNGDGTFQPPAQYDTTSSYAVALGDFNGDGVVDLAVTNIFENNVQIFLGLPGVCSYVLSPPGGAAVDRNGGAASVAVQTNGLACTWTATANEPWFQISRTAGTGSGDVIVTIPPNETGADQTGSITIAGQTIAVTQRDTVQRFSDVPPSAYYFDAVNLLASKSIHFRL